MYAKQSRVDVFVTLSSTMDNKVGVSWDDWAKGGYRGPPPSRRALRPTHLVLSLALLVGLLTVFVLAASGRLS